MKEYITHFEEKARELFQKHKQQIPETIDVSIDPPNTIYKTRGIESRITLQFFQDGEVPREYSKFKGITTIVLAFKYTPDRNTLEEMLERKMVKAWRLIMMISADPLDTSEEIGTIENHITL